MPSRRDLLLRGIVGIAVVTGLTAGVLAWSSTLLGEYSVLEMGQAAGGHDGHAAGGVDVRELVVDPARRADVRVDLVARRESIRIPGGRAVEGYTVNGTSPGPTIEARQGDLVEVEFRNESVPAGATLHWHGIDVPNAEDGVAGITQDAVAVGESFVYRFIADTAGTYWYHSHQVSHEQVLSGLFGAVVIRPREPAAGDGRDALAVLHVYGGQHTLNGRAGDAEIPAEPGEAVRVRIVNTDQGTATAWSSSPLRVLAIDGRDLPSPVDVGDERVRVPAGGRVDVEVVAPERGAARVQFGGGLSALIGDADAPPAEVRQPDATFDPLHAGTPAPLGFDPAHPDREFDYVIGRRFGIIDGRPGNFWTINGRMFPDVPMFEVAEGDVVVMHLVNDSGDVHPMHLHGHHAVVLARDGEAATGAPWWVDTLDVRPGESYDIAFVADNPGIWTDHCHTLEHAVDGLVAHLMYEGVTTPFRIGGASGNHPE